MSQINAATLLSDAQINAAVEFNKSLNLSPTSIKILQNHVSEEITGEIDRTLVSDLIKQDYQEVYLRTWLENKLKQLGSGSVPDTWESVLSYISDVANRSIASEVHSKLGHLHEDVFFAIIQDMAQVESQNLALMLFADYFKYPLSEKTFYFRYDPKLAYPYLTHIPFTDIMVSPLVDNQRVNGVFSIPQAPTKQLNIQFGPSVFTSLAGMKDAFTKALQVEVKQVSVPPVSSGLSADVKAERLKKAKVRISSENAIRVIQGLGGVPITGNLDETVIDAIANFQKKQGLGVDGDLGSGTLKQMIKVLKEKNLFEAAVQLIIGFYGMWDKDVAGIFYYSDMPNDGAEVDQSLPGAKVVEFGHLVFSQSPEDVAKSIIKGLSPLITYRGSNFTGPHSPLIDVDFLEAIRKVNEYAGIAGVSIYVTGASAASFRKEGGSVSGAIVTPAKYSNHLIGHAIDMNLIVDGKHYNSGLLKDSANWPDQIARFIEFLRNDEGLRWGGDFNDPVHIDDGVNTKDKPRFEQRYYATQTCVGFQPGLRSLERGGEEEHECGN